VPQGLVKSRVPGRCPHLPISWCQAAHEDVHRPQSIAFFDKAQRGGLFTILLTVKKMLDILVCERFHMGTTMSVLMICFRI